MISLYIQINLFIVASFVVFQLLPKTRLRFSSSKRLAQSLLLCSLIVAPLLSFLPDFTFPSFDKDTRLTSAQEVDASPGASSSIHKALLDVAHLTNVAPEYAQGLPPLWIGLFYLGMIVMVGRRLLSWHRLGRLLEATVALHKIGRVTVAVSHLIAVPFSAWRVGRAYVVLPVELIPFQKDFRIALRHEIEHHRRSDTLWALMLEWLVCGFYLNPTIYLWRKIILELQELACDEALISRMRISKQAYGSCLLRVAEMALERRFMCAGTTCMIPTSESNSHSFLRRRINMFAQHERAKARRALVVALGTVSSFSLLAAAYIAQAAIRSDDSANPGHPVFNSPIQPLAEQALRKGMAQHKASAGFAIVGDPVRGTVIAAVSLNDGFDKNLKGDWALSYPLQPGSALKPLIIASALQKNLTKIDEMHSCEWGEFTLGKNRYHDSEPFGKLSTADAVIQSSNICTIKVAQRLGAKGLEISLREFGLGKDGSAQDFPAARAGRVPAAGVIADDDFVGLVSHGISNRTEMFVTPLEMVEAYGAIANGGRLMKAITADGKQSPQMIREVLSPEVSAQMRDALKRVVEEGTAKGIKGSTFSLAGKTSTVLLNNNQRVTGFIGYAPADKPKLVVYVALFDPKGPKKFGSNTAAPVFREIVEKAILVYNP